MGDQNGTLQIFLSISSSPWREIELKGSITAVKIGSLFNKNENYLVVVTLEGNFYIFDMHSLSSEYEQERELEKFNDNFYKIQEFNKIEEINAEELMNEVDLDFECHFDQNLSLGRRKSSGATAGFYMDSSNSSHHYIVQGRKHSNNEGNLNALQNKKLGDKYIKELEPHFEDKVPCNCCLLEIFPIYDGSGDQKPKDTIFMGTYDGHLHAMRMSTKKDDLSECLTIIQLKKWNFSNPILSLIHFDFVNQNKNFQHAKSGMKTTKSVSSGLDQYGNFGSNSNKTFSMTITIGGGSNSSRGAVESSTKKKKDTTQPDNSKQQNFFDFYYQANQQKNTLDLESVKKQQTQQTSLLKKKGQMFHKTFENQGVKDILLIIGLADNIIVPFSYSSERVNLEVDKIEKHIKKLSESYNAVNESSKPFLTRIYSSKIKRNNLDYLLPQKYEFAVATNDGNLLIMNAQPVFEKIRDHSIITADNILLYLKKEEKVHQFGSSFFNISKKTITIKIMDLNKDQIIKRKALVLSGVDGYIYFYILNEGQTNEYSKYIPQCFKFDIEMRIKAIKIGSIRLYGRAEKPTKCLFAFAYEDYAFVFYEFVIDINIKHISFKSKMNLRVKRELIEKEKTVKKIQNPILTKIIDHFKKL